MNHKGSGPIAMLRTLSWPLPEGEEIADGTDLIATFDYIESDSLVILLFKLPSERKQ